MLVRRQLCASPQTSEVQVPVLSWFRISYGSDLDSVLQFFEVSMVSITHFEIFQNLEFASGFWLKISSSIFLRHFMVNLSLYVSKCGLQESFFKNTFGVAV